MSQNSQSPLIITNGYDSFTMNCSECVNLELKLNISSMGKQYSAIGDYLYNYGAKYNTTSCPPSLYVLSDTEYQYLVKLRQLSYDDIKNASYTGKPIV